MACPNYQCLQHGAELFLFNDHLVLTPGDEDADKAVLRLAAAELAEGELSRRARMNVKRGIP